ncbi:NACHT, LRR and PYD domains-containing protein 12-like [Harpia harpyja]|uniref:NACHT, LRR and PYD domains-containing protein 12-like n=1 Tax=Harpia harpyja TaxID=202280 RepID=UPI0022B15E4D|nr:NACHT, LRR and PYD domains-containing protein 12-like [Harpia harpyja]XP_052667928.1 NACHT, LRR and PYD domains-containing protein 12-like [Harpia harpyja]
MAGEERALAVLLQALQDLTPKDFQEFKTKLSEVHVEGGWNIPKDSLAKAAHPSTLVSCVGKNYSEDAAMDIAIGLFEEMNQRDLAEKLLDEKVKEYKRKYREHVVREFLRYKEVNSCLGKNLSVKSRYTALTIARKPRSKHGGEHEAAGTSHGCADVSNGPATITVTAQTLFKADEDGQTPQVVVLVGAPGMGKTMMIRKVMVEWVEGTAYTQFDYIFCIDCKDIAFTKEASVADLVSKCCPHRRTPAGKILDDQKKILFIFDGFEALGFSLVQPKDELSSDPREVKPLETTLMSLLKKTVLPESSLLITTRPTALQSLGQCLEGEYYAEILGFSAAMREEYFHRYFENDNKANVAFSFARGNKILYSLCVIPVMSWTICTILEQELNKKKNLIECSKATTQMSVFYLSRLMKCRDRDNLQDLQQFLRELCSMAADGIWKHKVLFEEKEIKDHSLDQPDLLPLFLNEKISKKGVDHGNVYSFTHLHLQEFFAAMFYVLEDDEEMVDDAGALVKDVNMLLESYSESRKDLNLTVRFLFGLVSQKSIEYVNEIIGCRISSRAREDMLRWLQGRPGGIAHPGQALKVSELDAFHFLFEMNEKSFVQSALGHFTEIDLQDIKLTLYDQMALSFCIRQWVGLGCVTLRGCSFDQQDPREELATSVPCSGASGAGGRRRPLAEEEPDSPIHPLCRALRHPGSDLRVLRLQWCGLSESCCAELSALLAEHPSLRRLELGDGTLGDGGVRLLCEGLRQPGCRLRVLRLRYSRLTSACCEDLAGMLGASPCLEELDLSFSEGLRDAGVRLLCEGLQNRACQLQTLRLGSCRLTGACCRTLAARLVESPRLTCLDLSDNELGADGVLQLCQQLRHPACPLQALGLSTSGLNEDVLQELAALRALKPDLKIGYLLEQDAPQPGAMARLPFNRGVLPGTGGPGGRKTLPSCRRGPCNNRSRF